MEKATSTLRRSGAFLLSFGARHQELNLIVSDLKMLKSQVKAVRDSQQTILQDLTNWTCVEENRALQELFLHLSDLNSLWSEVQTQFADQIMEFKHHFEMIYESERGVDALRNKFGECEAAEEKALKKLKKAEKKNVASDITAAKEKVQQCKTQKELTHTEVSEKVKENEAVKFILVKDGFLKLSEAYLALSHKCIQIFEAQKDIVNFLPDVEDQGIHEVRSDYLSGAKDIIQRVRTMVKEYPVSQQSSQQGRNDPPPPYYPNLNTPYNPYYVNPAEPFNGPHLRLDGPSGLYPNVKPE